MSEENATAADASMKMVSSIATIQGNTLVSVYDVPGMEEMPMKVTLGESYKFGDEMPGITVGEPTN